MELFLQCEYLEVILFSFGHHGNGISVILNEFVSNSDDIVVKLVKEFCWCGLWIKIDDNGGVGGNGSIVDGIEEFKRVGVIVREDPKTVSGRDRYNMVYVKIGWFTMSARAWCDKVTIIGHIC